MDSGISENNIVDNYIKFKVNHGEQVMRVESDGTFFVNGRKVKKDIEVYNGMVKFLRDAGYYAEN